MTSTLRRFLFVPALVLLAACRGAEVDSPQATDPEGVFTDVALAEGDRVCEMEGQGDLLVSGVVLAHADANMHRVGECRNPTHPLYTHEQQAARPAAEQDRFVRVGENRYFRVAPAASTVARPGAERGTPP